MPIAKSIQTPSAKCFIEGPGHNQQGWTLWVDFPFWKLSMAVMISFGNTVKPPHWLLKYWRASFLEVNHPALSSLSDHMCWHLDHPRSSPGSLKALQGPLLKNHCLAWQRVSGTAHLVVWCLFSCCSAFLICYVSWAVLWPSSWSSRFLLLLSASWWSALVLPAPSVLYPSSPPPSSLSLVPSEYGSGWSELLSNPMLRGDLGL